MPTTDCLDVLDSLSSKVAALLFPLRFYFLTLVSPLLSTSL